MCVRARALGWACGRSAVVSWCVVAAVTLMCRCPLRRSSSPFSPRKWRLKCLRWACSAQRGPPTFAMGCVSSIVTCARGWPDAPAAVSLRRDPLRPLAMHALHCWSLSVPRVQRRRTAVVCGGLVAPLPPTARAAVRCAADALPPPAPRDCPVCLPCCCTLLSLLCGVRTAP
jgi:hypothetical protein